MNNPTLSTPEIVLGNSWTNVTDKQRLRLIQNILASWKQGITDIANNHGEWWLSTISNEQVIFILKNMIRIAESRIDIHIQNHNSSIYSDPKLIEALEGFLTRNISNNIYIYFWWNKESTPLCEALNSHNNITFIDIKDKPLHDGDFFLTDKNSIRIENNWWFFKNTLTTFNDSRKADSLREKIWKAISDLIIHAEEEIDDAVLSI